MSLAHKLLKQSGPFMYGNDNQITLNYNIFS